MHMCARGLFFFSLGLKMHVTASFKANASSDLQRIFASHAGKELTTNVQGPGIPEGAYRAMACTTLHSLCDFVKSNRPGVLLTPVRALPEEGDDHEASTKAMISMMALAGHALELEPSADTGSQRVYLTVSREPHQSTVQLYVVTFPMNKRKSTEALQAELARMKGRAEAAENLVRVLEQQFTAAIRAEGVRHTAALQEVHTIACQREAWYLRRQQTLLENWQESNEQVVQLQAQAAARVQTTGRKRQRTEALDSAN